MRVVGAVRVEAVCALESLYVAQDLIPRKEEANSQELPMNGDRGG